MMVHQVSALIDKLREARPLVHNMTNVVVTNFTANGLLALGASPVMAYAREEVADMASIAGALVLNLGTLSEDTIESMIVAGQSANAHGVPVLLDPVGAGATRYRTASALRVLHEVQVSLVRGNASELANLIGEQRVIKGVDAGDSAEDERMELAVRAARSLHTVVAITGPEDVITDGQAGYIVKGGHPLLAQVTGAGCLLTSVLGSFAAVERDVLLAELRACLLRCGCVRCGGTDGRGRAGKLPDCTAGRAVPLESGFAENAYGSEAVRARFSKGR